MVVAAVRVLRVDIALVVGIEWMPHQFPHRFIDTIDGKEKRVVKVRVVGVIIRIRVVGRIVIVTMMMAMIGRQGWRWSWPMMN